MNFYDKTRLQIAIESAPKPIADELQSVQEAGELTVHARKTLDFIECVLGRGLLPGALQRARAAGLPESFVESEVKKDPTLLGGRQLPIPSEGLTLVELETYLVWDEKSDAIERKLRMRGYGPQEHHMRIALRAFREAYRAQLDPTKAYKQLQGVLKR